MAKRVAVIAVNPVNGLGLFEYLEAFFENGIPYKTFAVAEQREIKANSGVALTLDDVIANLKGHEDEFDALVFACGDAMIRFRDMADKPYNRDMLAVIRNFHGKGKLIVGHCAAAILFDAVGISDGKRVAVHPLGKAAVKNAVATDEKKEVHGNIYTSQTEHAIREVLPELLAALK